jgi:glycosyltransferase involved in cell wall biosynthesis
MRVVLFAPYLSVESGGIWNFYQWVARYLGASFQYLHVGPAMLLEEIRKAGGEGATQVSLESLRSSTESTFIYRLLEDRAGAGTVAFKISCYGRLMNSLKSLYTRKATERAAAKLLRRESVDVVHIPAQLVPMPKVVRNYPYIINPHDYQHEHFPEFFPKRILRLRRKLWYRDQRNANAVVVHSRQTRLDALRFLGIPEERLFYAPYGPLDNFPEPDDGTLQRTIDDFKLPRRFVFYPARSWPHKNHAVLVEALARLKKRGIEVNAVFTTVEGEYGEAVKEKIRAAGLERQVSIVGRVSPEEMGSLYKLCTMVVVPSLFEQNSGPVLEAIHFGKSIVASQLEEVVSTLDGAGSLVDPHSVQEIADAIDQLWSSEDTLEKAGAAIRKRRSLMSWKPFQDAYRSAYTYAIEHFH